MILAGECMKVKIENRPHIGRLITICVHDDGNWFEKFSFDEHWLGELIDLLTVARSQSTSKGVGGG